MSARTSIQAFHDTATGTVSYVVWDTVSRQAAVIDPVLDYDFKSGHTGTESVSRLVTCLDENALQLQWILETHVHADHLSGAQTLKQRAGGCIAIGENIREVQETFRKLYDLERRLPARWQPVRSSVQ